MPEAVSLVLRFPDILLSRHELETRVGRVFDRFECNPRGGYYGQINLCEDAGWAVVIDAIDRIGPSILTCIERCEIGRPRADFDRYVEEDRLSATFVVPNEAATRLAHWGFDIEISFYVCVPD